MTDAPRKIYVDIGIDAGAILGDTADDAAIGKLVRLYVRSAMEKIKRATPLPVLPALEMRLSAYDNEEWKAWKAFMETCAP